MVVLFHAFMNALQLLMLGGFFYMMRERVFGRLNSISGTADHGMFMLQQVGLVRIDLIEVNLQPLRVLVEIFFDTVQFVQSRLMSRVPVIDIVSPHRDVGLPVTMIVVHGGIGMRVVIHKWFPCARVEESGTE